MNYYKNTISKIAKTTTFLVVLMMVCLFAHAQVDFIERMNKAVDGHQSRIDAYDGSLDGTVSLLSDVQSQSATKLYIYKVNQVQKNINFDNNLKPLEKKRLLTDLSNMLEKVDGSNYFMYNASDIYFDMILKVQEVVDSKRMVSILKSDVHTALHIIPFFDFKPYAPEILKHAARVDPSALLTKFADFAYQKYAVDILEEICLYAPMHVSFYMGTNNPVYITMMEANGKPTIATMLEVFNKVGSNSRAYLLLDQISRYRLTVKEAHQMGLDRDSMFKYLMKIRESSGVMGAYSIDDELTYSSLQRIRHINELHEEKDDVRFLICDTIPLSSAELYNLMVYGEDEIYTSTFLGLFNRFMRRLTIKSSYEFLHSVGMNRYRTFIKMNAAYNTLPTFLGRMSEWEKRSLFNKLVGGLQHEVNPLEQAVTVADTYGSLDNEADRQIFITALKNEYQQVRWNNSAAEKLYGMLMTVLGISPDNTTISDDIMASSTLSNASLFKNDQHVEQHLFFDDEDGRGSYVTFIKRFLHPGWMYTDKGFYIILQSTQGKQIKIYANKPEFEYDGQQAIRKLFISSGRFPDVVVHRGHSYYASATIETITPNTDLVILGSCGGYNNINAVLNFAPRAQIITSKQVGTMLVNNELIFTICEQLRLGKDLDWENIWNVVGKSIKSSSVATERFDDYLPPHKNLGALLVRNYRASL